MDDFSITDARLYRALDQLRWVNRMLGGHRATLRALAPFLRARSSRPVRILDVGTGVADFPEYLVRWGARRGLHVHVLGLDANPATVDYAGGVLDRRLPPALRSRVELLVGDARSIPLGDGAVDVSICSLFLHHFDTDQAVRVLREMNRVARDGVVVNDLHRHVLAYLGIRTIVHLLPVSGMFRHDGPVSVLRAFRRGELVSLARSAGLPTPDVRWNWAFRWVMSTLGSSRQPEDARSKSRMGARA